MRFSIGNLLGAMLGVAVCFALGLRFGAEVGLSVAAGAFVPFLLYLCQSKPQKDK
jgi:hypothetical protein